MPFMQAVEASDGQMILRKGDPADRLFYIDEGCVVIEDGYDPEMVESIGWLPLVSLMIYIFAFSIG